MEIGAGILLDVAPYNNVALQSGITWFDTAATRGITATFGIAIAW
jgi:hypothetical protein